MSKAILESAPARQPEEFSELLAMVERQREAMRHELKNADTMLDAFHILLDPESREKPFERVFSLLTQMFDADVIIALRKEPSKNTFRVIDSTEPVEYEEWPSGPFFDKISKGKVRSLINTDVLDECCSDKDNIASMSVGLFIPMQEPTSQGFLAILRKQTSFSNKDIELAKRFSLLASHAFASSNAMEQRAESARLRELTKSLSESQKKLKQLAHYDSLSGLPNRVELENLTEFAIANHKSTGQPFSFIYIDLNDFKLVNDHHGHDAGDELIVSIANRMTTELGQDAIISRISGDEFAIILKNVDESRIYDYLQQLDNLFDDPFNLTFGNLYAKASFGAAIYPLHGKDFATLRRRSDNAMYRAKANPRGNFMVYDRSMSKASTARMDLEQKIRRGIQNGQVHCWMQPQVDVDTGKIAGFECLARLQDGEGGYVHTGDFIQVASGAGLLDEITQQVIDQALASIDDLKAKYPGVRVSFNVAPYQACDDDFIKDLIDKLSSANCIDMMTMEITEDAILGTSTFEKRILPLLKKAGLEVAIDDFGTGYSSLSLIGSLPINELKIDRSFIWKLADSPNQLSVLKSITTLAQDLNLRVVAEGVETEEQKNALLDLNVSLIQGFLLGKPAPIKTWLS